MVSARHCRAHDVRATQADGHVVEERLFAEVDDWVISGAIDLQRSESDGTITILDYKCTSVGSVIFGKIEWVKQLNFYGWLAERITPTSRFPV